MPKIGFEPTYLLRHQNLNLACLPVPPLGHYNLLQQKVPRIGLEPTHLAVPEPKSGVSANFTTWAKK